MGGKFFDIRILPQSDFTDHKRFTLTLNIMFHFILLPYRVHITLDTAYILHILEWSVLPLFTVVVENMLLEAMKI